MTYGPYNEEEIRWHIQRAAMDLVEPLINNWSDRSQKNDAEMTGSAGMIANVVCNHVLLMQRAGSDPQATLREALLPLIDDPEILNLVTKLLKKNWFVIVDASEKHTLQYFPQIPASEAARTSNVAISSPARNEGRETIVAGEKKSVLGGRNLEEAAILPSTTAPIAISASRHAKRSLRPHAIEKYREREHSSPALFPYTVLKSNWEMLPKEYAASCTCTVSVSHQWMVPRTCVTVEHIPCDVTDINELIPFFMDYATVCAIQCDEMRMCAMVRFLNFPAVEALLDTPYFLFGKPQVTISPCTPLEVCSLYNPSESTFTEAWRFATQRNPC